jgi:hypothetical protein
MKMKRYVNLRWVLAATLTPLILLGLFALVVLFHGLLRFDPAYFTEPYLERYGTPGGAARALETALQTDDRDLLAELQGRRRSVAFETSPRIIFVMLWDRDDRFFTYLYQDLQTYERYTYHFEEVKGRYVVTAPDAYYYWHSGSWLLTFLPAAIAWWLVEIVVVLAVWLYRLSARMRQQMYRR